MDQEKFGKLQSVVNDLSTNRLLDLLISIVTTLQWRFVMNHIQETVTLPPRDTDSEPDDPQETVEEEHDGSIAESSDAGGDGWRNSRNDWGPREPPAPPPAP